MPLSLGDEIEILFTIARTFDKHAELRTAFAPVLSLIEVETGLTNGMVTLLNRADGLLKIEEACGLSREEKKRGVYRLGEGFVGRVFESGTAICIPNRDASGMAYYCVPVCSGGTVMGTLSAERRLSGGADSGVNSEAVMANDKSFLEKTALIIADAAKLREKILEGISGKEQKPQGGSGAAGGGASAKSGRIAPDSPLVGTSNALRSVYEMIEQVAPSDATVLITGESGTGKELIAAEICRLSKRKNAPFFKLNCAALPESIIESELFGHERGAFTGAVQLRKGRFELADSGTIFLDEIAELSQPVQVKLLRVLQEREIERLGAASTIKVDVRLIAATNKNLEREMSEGRFREDLFYRLNVFPLRLPPLRERSSDIMLLADYFTEKYAEKNGKSIKRIAQPAIDLLTAYSWPGNVRELENCIERAVILSKDMVIHAYHLPPSLQSAVSTHTEPAATLDAALSRLEKEMIVEALSVSSGNKCAAARALGITERQIGLRIQHYGINWRLFRH